MSKGKKIFVGASKFIVAIALIAFLVQSGRLDFAQLKTLWNFKVVVIGILMIGVTVATQIWRWQILLIGRNFAVDFATVARLFLIGIFFNYALPGSIGGDVVKAYYLAKNYRDRRMDSVMTVILDRLLGLYAMVILALVAIVLNLDVINTDARLKTLAIGTLALSGLMTLFWMTAFSRRIRLILRVDDFLILLPGGKKLINAYRAAQEYGQKKMVIVYAVLLSAVAQVMSTFFMIFIGYSLNLEGIPWSAYFFAVPLGFIAASLPIAPAGLGVGQFAFLALFQLYLKEPTPIGQMAVTAFQLGLFAWGLLGAFFYLHKRDQFEKMAEST